MARNEERSRLVEQIQRLLEARLLDPLDILLDGDAAVDEVRRLARRRAENWAETMTGDNHDQATRVTARLIASLYPGDEQFNPPADFWHTPLGKAVVYQVGHPTAESVSYATAGAMLGISRQGVHDLVRRGKLPRHPDGGVPVEAVRERLGSAARGGQVASGSRGAPVAAAPGNRGGQLTAGDRGAGVHKERDDREML